VWVDPLLLPRSLDRKPLKGRMSSQLRNGLSQRSASAPDDGSYIANGHERLPGRSCDVARTPLPTLVTSQEARQARRSGRRPDHMPDSLPGRADPPVPIPRDAERRQSGILRLGPRRDRNCGKPPSRCRQVSRSKPVGLWTRFIYRLSGSRRESPHRRRSHCGGHCR
jgi:hypothetical protein